jgi:hypothetical protein
MMLHCGPQSCNQALSSFQHWHSATIWEEERSPLQCKQRGAGLPRDKWLWLCNDGLLPPAGVERELPHLQWHFHSSEFVTLTLHPFILQGKQTVQRRYAQTFLPRTYSCDKSLCTTATPAASLPGGHTCPGSQQKPKEQQHSLQNLNNQYTQPYQLDNRERFWKILITANCRHSTSHTMDKAKVKSWIYGMPR